ncbi:hypothetical protein [Anaerorhabdus sp.]|uniref:hypothetical protein n=1 Tax=Anaerorhabdus sp. TaxID=1872524 RepID=UPI002FC77EF7
MKYYITISLSISGLACLLFTALTNNVQIGILMCLLFIAVTNTIGIVKIFLELEDIKDFQTKYSKKIETRFDEIDYQAQRVKDILLNKESK